MSRRAVEPQTIGAGVPAGWSYNPSTWGQRLPVPDAALGAFGYLLDAITGATLNSMLCGVLLALFALVEGPAEEHLGGGWRAVRRP